MRYIGITLLLLISLLTGFSQDNGEITPAHVFQLTMEVRGELELIREALNQEKNESTKFAIIGASPYEVYFEALSLFEKSGNLLFEITRETSDNPKALNREARPADVFNVINQSLEQLLTVKEKLGITKRITKPEFDASKVPNDVFISVVQANRQVNLLLQKKVGPGDVFQIVTKGIAYANAIYLMFKGNRIPEVPDYSPDKIPADVYGKLLQCHALEKKLASGIPLRMAEVGEATHEQIVPSDVYDLASLVVAELEFLYQKTGCLNAVPTTYWYGEKFPSDVFQRASLLEIYLQELIRLSETNKEILSVHKSVDDGRK